MTAHSRVGAKREAALDAAEALVLEMGAAHLTIDAVAARAGVSTGGVLHHFPTKAQLIEAMLDRSLAVFENDADIIERIAGSDLKAQVHAWIRLTEASDPKVEGTAAALLSAAANQPEQLSHLGQMLSQRLAKHIGNPGYAKAMAIRTAPDGYWLFNAPANILPVRAKPDCTSSAISTMPCASHLSRRA